MTNLEILDYLVECGYDNNYICMCFMFSGDSYKKWFLTEISSNPKYEYLIDEITNDMVDKFMNNLNDEECNLREYFKMCSILQRADIHMAKKQRSKVYSKIMGIDESTALMLYLEYPKECENDMWDKICKDNFGEDYKEKFWHERCKEQAYYIDKTTGKLKSLKKEKESKMFYLYGLGTFYNYEKVVK